jgi:transglutaminase-like putative cysteine protease
MLLQLTHTTDLTYTDLITESVMELRMAPRQEMDQHRLSFDLAIGPETQVTSYFDWLGNTVHAFTVSKFHSRIRIIASSVVETDRPKREPEKFRDRWPFDRDSLAYEMWDFLQIAPAPEKITPAAGPVFDCGPLRSLLENASPKSGEPAGELVTRLLSLIHGKFAYEKGVTTAASPITDILTHGKGVCQDFTHLLIALARVLGIPARYVSGLVHPDATSRHRGATHTHAWAELFFPTQGWVGFDATNKCVVGENFVKVAIGRDFRDVPPNKGLFRGPGKESIHVTVTSEELKAIPPELVPERFRRLDIPSYLDGNEALIQMEQEQKQLAN